MCECSDAVCDLPPQQEAEHGGKESILYQVDTVQHLGAAWSAEGLRDAEELLVYLLIDPFGLLHELVIELLSSPCQPMDLQICQY